MPRSPTEIPTEIVLNLKRQGLTNNQIVQYLQREGYNSQQIYDALNQSEAKTTIEGYTPSEITGDEDLEVPSPTPEQEPISYTEPMPEEEYAPVEYTATGRELQEQIEIIAESIISEKWREFTRDVGDITIWKSEIQTELINIKRDIKNLNKNLENLQTAIIGKVSEYNKSLTNVSSQMQALEKVFQNILPPLTSNVKELSAITETLKKKSTTKIEKTKRK